jgi:hypothetical protein
MNVANVCGNSAVFCDDLSAADLSAHELAYLAAQQAQHSEAHRKSPRDNAQFRSRRTHARMRFSGGVD